MQEGQSKQKSDMKKVMSYLGSLSMCYVLTGMLLMVALGNAVAGDWWRAVTSALYAFICFGMAQVIKQNQWLKRIIVFQQKFIDILVKDDEQLTKPEPPTFEESQGERKEG